jgi:riboflavin transporter FmnP
MKSIRKLTLAALFLALGLLLPFLTGQIREIGNKLLPMHIPVLICGVVCGWKYGLLVGFLTPLLRFFLFSMPAIPNALTMAFELAAYGAIISVCYEKLKKVKANIYISLLIAMISGRLVWGIASMIVYGISKSTFTWPMFVGGALLNAIPGIILQLVLIPILMLALEKSGVIKDASI